MTKYALIVSMLTTIFVQTQSANLSNNNVVPPYTIPLASETDMDYWDDFQPFKNATHDEFDWKLIKEILLNDPSANVIFSPFSLKLLLSLLNEAAGRDTTTHKELNTVLPKIETEQQAREYYGKIFASLLYKSDEYDLSLGTKLYVDSYVQPLQRFSAIIEAHYSTKIETIDFHRAGEAAKTINAWCAEVTRNHIKDLVQKDDIENSVMLLLNAIYFNGYWRRPFPSNQTRSGAFYKTPTISVQTPFMSQTAHFYYTESKALDAKLLRLPYKGKKFAMIIILPNSKGGVDELIRQLNPTSIPREKFLMDEVEVEVVLPKFKFEFTGLMNEVLKRLGIHDIFTPEASLAALARGQYIERRLFVSKVLQKAGIYVNEKGSTVYAATDIVLTNKFGGDITREFIANRPFVYVIEDESTGTLLFAGKVTNPETFDF